MIFPPALYFYSVILPFFSLSQGDNHIYVSSVGGEKEYGSYQLTRPLAPTLIITQTFMLVPLCVLIYQLFTL